MLTPTTTWMNPEDMMLSEISQSQKDKYSDFAPLRGLQESDPSRWWVPGAGEKDGELVFNGHSFSLSR